MATPVITWKRSFKIELSGHKHYLRVDLDTTGLCSCDQYINPLGKVCREDKKVMYLSESEQHLKISRIIWLSTCVLQPQIAVTVSWNLAAAGLFLLQCPVRFDGDSNLLSVLGVLLPNSTSLEDIYSQGKLFHGCWSNPVLKHNSLKPDATTTLYLLYLFALPMV